MGNALLWHIVGVRHIYGCDVAMLKDIKSEWNLIRYKNDGNKVKSFSVERRREKLNAKYEKMKAFFPA